nr:hypothetical protein [Tanacetum cinerariifolium]
PGVPDGQAIQTIIPNNAAFQTEDLDTYGFDCDDILNAQAVLMANISNYGFDNISEECLLQTFTAFKREPKEKKAKNIKNEIDLEKKIKELDNIIFKVGKSAHTVHMLTKPQGFYTNIHKQALGYQNPFYLKKAQRIKPTLYDGLVIYAKHVVVPVINDEETLILEEQSRSKMLEKDKDPEAIKQKNSNKHIDYVKLNKSYKDFRERFVPQQELSTNKTLWYHMLNPSTKSFDALPVKIEVPKELPKVSLVNESLKKLKLHLANFNKVVKIRTTPNAQTEELFAFNDLKAQLQDKDSTICKLKDIIKPMREKFKEKNVNYDYGEIVTKNIELENRRFNFRRTSLTGFPTQRIRSSNAIALDSPYLLVLITGASQSRQHVDTSLIHLESRKSPTAELFDDDSGRICIHHCEYQRVSL